MDCGHHSQAHLHTRAGDKGGGDSCDDGDEDFEDAYLYGVVVEYSHVFSVLLHR